MNTIPSFLEFLFEFRNLPHDNPGQISQAIKDYSDSRNAKRIGGAGIPTIACGPGCIKEAHKEV